MALPFDVASQLVDRVRALPAGRRLIAVDGVDGSGKTCFAANLAESLRQAGESVVEVHIDDFHHLRDRRYERGRMSPEGFWLDSYDYAALERDVLQPLSDGGSGVYRSRATDLDTDAYLDVPPLQAPDRSITLVEGIFLHRNELARWWDFSVFLDVPFSESVRRMADRDGSPADAEDPRVHRYVEGQRLYFEQCRPWERASVVVDNSDFSAPVLGSAGEARAAAEALRLRSRFEVDDADLSRLHARAFGEEEKVAPWRARLERHSVSWVGAFSGSELIGFVHACWDGGAHAFLLDTAVHPTWQRRGVGRRVVEHLVRDVGKAGCEWLHVDYEPHLARFYEECGFRSTSAGVMRLTAS